MGSYGSEHFQAIVQDITDYRASRRSSTHGCVHWRHHLWSSIYRQDLEGRLDCDEESTVDGRHRCRSSSSNLLTLKAICHVPYKKTPIFSTSISSGLVG